MNSIMTLKNILSECCAKKLCVEGIEMGRQIYYQVCIQSSSFITTSYQYIRNCYDSHSDL